MAKTTTIIVNHTGAEFVNPKENPTTADFILVSTGNTLVIEGPVVGTKPTDDQIEAVTSRVGDWMSKRLDRSIKIGDSSVSYGARVKKDGDSEIPEFTIALPDGARFSLAQARTIASKFDDWSEALTADSGKKPASGSGDGGKKPADSGKKPASGSGDSGKKPADSGKKPASGSGDGGKKPADSGKKPASGSGDGGKKPADSGDSGKKPSGTVNPDVRWNPALSVDENLDAIMGC